MKICFLFLKELTYKIHLPDGVAQEISEVELSKQLGTQ